MFNNLIQISFSFVNICLFIDVTSPSLLCNNASNVTRENGTSSVTFNVSCVDNFDDIITPSCDHDSGFLFPVGETKVTCWCSDASHNTKDCSFIATVYGKGRRYQHI